MVRVMAQPAVAARPRRKIRIGVVVSNRMRKTIVVRVTRLVRHPKYVRTLERSNTFKAHDETNRAKIGDVVKIMETRPLSKDKRWRLVEVLQQASSAPPIPEDETQKPNVGSGLEAGGSGQAPQGPEPRAPSPEPT